MHRTPNTKYGLRSRTSNAIMSLSIRARFRKLAKPRRINNFVNRYKTVVTYSRHLSFLIIMYCFLGFRQQKIIFSYYFSDNYSCKEYLNKRLAPILIDSSLKHSTS